MSGQGLSDLELVAQAMAPTEPQPQRPSQADATSSAPKQTNGTSSTTAVLASNPPISTTKTTTTTERSPPSAPVDLSQIPGLEDIDLSSLSSAELDSLRPILQALSLSQGPDGLGGEDEEGEFDEGRIEEIMRQFEIADSVADDLEGKLDRLLDKLGGVEEEINIEHDRDQDQDQDGGVVNGRVDQAGGGNDVSGR